MSDILDLKVSKRSVELEFNCSYCGIVEKDKNIPTKWKTDKYQVEVVHGYDGDPHALPELRVGSNCPECQKYCYYQYSLAELFEQLLAIKQALYNHLRSSTMHNI